VCIRLYNWICHVKCFRLTFGFAGLPVRPDILKAALYRLRQIHPIVKTVQEISVDDRFISPDADNASEVDLSEQISFAPMQCNVPHVLRNPDTAVIDPEHLRISSAPVPQIGRRHMESGAHPNLYPSGEFDFSHPRERKVTFGAYVKHRLMQNGSRCAKSIAWLFHMTHLLFLVILNRQSMVWTRLTNMPKTNDRPSRLASDQYFRFIKRMRGTEPYWMSQLNNLLARVRQWGLPTVSSQMQMYHLLFLLTRCAVIICVLMWMFVEKCFICSSL